MLISKASNDSQLYFWFFPSENPAGSDEILIWLNEGVRFYFPTRQTHLPGRN
jgi:hypothetical protein